MSNPKNKVQAPHHQIVAIEEAERAIEAGRAIGTNDIISHALRHLDPRVAAPMAHALSYQLRIGAKDDEQMEIEKAIWWLMDAHNRLSDIRGKDREYAPWEYTGKIKDVENKVEETKIREYDNWEYIPNALVKEGSIYGVLNKEVFKAGDTIKFENLSPNSSQKEGAETLLHEVDASYLPSKVALRTSEGVTHGWSGSVRVYKKIVKG